MRNFGKQKPKMSLCLIRKINTIFCLSKKSIFDLHLLSNYLRNWAKNSQKWTMMNENNHKGQKIMYKFETKTNFTTFSKLFNEKKNVYFKNAITFLGWCKSVLRKIEHNQLLSISNIITSFCVQNDNRV
jgi:hypothetical protein